MTRLSLGATHSCARCRNKIPREEIGAVEQDHWLCSGCWNLWKILKDQTLGELMQTFLRSGNTQDVERAGSGR